MLFDFYQQNLVPLQLSDQAETGSGGDQPVRNNLTEGNGKGGEIQFPPSIFFHSFR